MIRFIYNLIYIYIYIITYVYIHMCMYIYIYMILYIYMLYAGNRKSAIPSENATENPLDTSSNNPLDKRQSFGQYHWQIEIPMEDATEESVGKRHWESAMISEVSISGAQSMYVCVCTYIYIYIYIYMYNPHLGLISAPPPYLLFSSKRPFSLFIYYQKGQTHTKLWPRLY